MKALLEKMVTFAGQAVGQKPGDQWKGSDSGPPGKKLVGDSVEPEESILKDLSKGPKPKSKEKELAEQFEHFLQALEEDNLGVEEKRPARKGSRPSRPYSKEGEPSKRYTTVKEHGDQEGYDGRDQNPELAPGQKALKGKPIKSKDAGNIAQDALNTAFSGTAKDLTKNLSIRKSVDEDKEFNYKVTCDGYDKGSFVSKDDAIASAQKMIYGGEKEYTHIEVTDLSSHKKIWKWHGKKDVDEAKGDVPVISAFRRGMEKIAASGASNEEKQAAFDKLSAEFHKNAEAYSAKVKGKQQVKEYGANNPPQQTAGVPTIQQQAGVNDPKKVAATNQALTAIKAGTGSSAPTTNIAKALDAASQGTGVNTTDMKALEPMMKDLATVAQDPKLAGQFKTLAQQAQQAQKKTS